jgi:hypothetical protein
VVGAWPRNEFYWFYSLIQEAWLSDFGLFELAVLPLVIFLHLPEDHVLAGIQVLGVINPVLLNAEGQLPAHFGEHHRNLHQ